MESKCKADEDAAEDPRGLSTSFCVHSSGNPSAALNRAIRGFVRDYAWLELDDGVWHLTTRLTSEPSESVRRWSELQAALVELAAEGWMVVRPYPPLTPHESSATPSGYGLTRFISLSCR